MDALFFYCKGGVGLPERERRGSGGCLRRSEDENG